MTQSFCLVAGLGKTGRSIAGYLSRRNRPFIVFDTRPQPEGLDAFRETFPGVEVFCGELPASVYSQLSEIITSPGIALDEPFLQEAYSRNIPVLGDIECLAREIKVPVLAITGTNGKSTVTTLAGEMARAAGLSVAVAGNIGAPVLDLLDEGIPYDLWVLELSSFQLDLVSSLAPLAATILNVSADHLDRHHDLAAYVAAKQRIYRQAGVVIYNREDGQTVPAGKDSLPSPACGRRESASFGLDSPKSQEWGIIQQQGEYYLARGEEAFLPVSALKITGKHNWQNALAACALASAAKIGDQHIKSVLTSFSGLPHRCQWVRTLDEVTYINDSKGTNVGATISAISGIGGSMQGKIVLIAGGLGKGADFRQLRNAVTEYVRSLVLIGRDADKIEEALSDIVPVSNAATLDSAVSKARALAKPGDVVLLSPACASLDMFRDFNHRGESFADLVNLL